MYFLATDYVTSNMSIKFEYIKDIYNHFKCELLYTCNNLYRRFICGYRILMDILATFKTL